MPLCILPVWHQDTAYAVFFCMVFEAGKSAIDNKWTKKYNERGYEKHG